MSTCARFDVRSNGDTVDSGYISLGFLIGFFVGFILGFFLLWIFCFHFKFKRRSYKVSCLSNVYWTKADNSCGMNFNKATKCLDRGHSKVDDTDSHSRRNSTASHESIELRRRKSNKPDGGNRDQSVSDAFEVKSVVVRLELADPNSGTDRDNLPMVDAITQVTEQDGEQELVQQDWLATGQQERDLWRSRLFGLWQLAGALINRLAKDGVIDEDTRQRLLREHTDQLVSGRARVEAEIAADRQRRRAAASKASGTESAEATEAEAAEAEESKRAAGLDTAAQLEMARLRRQFASLSGLSAEKADELVAKLKTGVARLETRLAGQRMRQCAGMEEALARRRQLLAQQKAAEEEAIYGMEPLMQSRRLQLDGLVRNNKLSDADRQRLMAGYQKALLKQKEVFEKSYLTQQKSLADRLRQARSKQCQELEQRHLAELGRLTGRIEAGTETEPERVLDEFARLLESRTAKREALQEELDSRDCSQLDVLRDDLLQEKRNGEVRAEEELGRQLGLSEEDLGRLMDAHRRQVEKFTKDKRNEQLRSQRRLGEKLAERQAKLAAAQAARESEFEEVKRGQDQLLRKTLTLQLELDEQSRRQIAEEHDRHMLALGNSLQLSRLRQEKGLEAKLAARRAGMARMQRDTREAKLALDDAKLQAPGGEGEKLEAKLAERLEAERRKLEAESQEGRRRLRDRLAADTEAALRAQETRLGEVIGRLQTGQARRRGVIDRQEKVLQQLEAELEEKLASGRGGGSGGDLRGLDQILQSHKNQVASLTEQMEREKRQQEMLLKERLERRKLERQDEVKQTVDMEEQDAASALEKSGHGSRGQIARYVLELSLDAKFRNSMLSMEEEMRLEMKKQQEQLDREMEADLQRTLEDQRKRLFSELAKVSNIPKSEMQDMVERAGQSAGVSRRLSRQLSKDITEGVRQMKREDAAEAVDDARRDKRRPSSSKKPSSVGRAGQQYSHDFEDDD